MKTRYIVIIIILGILLFGSLAVYGILEYGKRTIYESHCLRDIASDYCKSKGWVFLGINTGMSFFKCGETERITWERGYDYNFLKEEIESCKYVKDERTEP